MMKVAEFIYYKIPLIRFMIFAFMKIVARIQIMINKKSKDKFIFPYLIHSAISWKELFKFKLDIIENNILNMSAIYDAIIDFKNYISSLDIIKFSDGIILDIQFKNYISAMKFYSYIEGMDIIFDDGSIIIENIKDRVKLKIKPFI